MNKNLTIKEVAVRLGVSRDTVERWVKAGKIKVHRKGIFPGKTSPIIISAEELDKLLKRMNEQAKS